MSCIKMYVLWVSYMQHGKCLANILKSTQVLGNDWIVTFSHTYVAFIVNIEFIGD